MSFAVSVWLLLALTLAQVSAWEPPALKVSDLPSDSLGKHYIELPTPRPSAAQSGGPSGGVLGDDCTRLHSCHKCLDRDDECAWCASSAQSSSSSSASGGHCVSRKNTRALCTELGGTVSAECPFFTRRLVWCAVIIAVCAMLSAGGGIGGGALFIPVFLIVLDLTAHQAVPLSKITIFGLAIGGLLVLVSKRHPYKDTALIDYDLVLLMVPCILLGTIAGVYLNVIFPSFIIVVSLVILLVYTSYKTWKKSFALYREEEAAASNQIREISLNDKKANAAGGEKRVSDALQPILEREAATPWEKFAIFLGGNRNPSMVGITCGSPAFFGLLAGLIPFLLGITVFIALRLLRQHREKVEAGYEFHPNDVIYSKFVVFWYPFLAFLSGVAAGFLGIGAGMVVAPIMLEIGVLAEVAQASSSFTVLFTSSSTSLQFMFLGKLPWKEAILFWIIGFLMSIIGQNIVAYLLKKYRKQSWVAFFLASMITLSGLSMFALNIHDLAIDGIHGEFHSPCATSIA